jgi:hypothetical protein
VIERLREAMIASPVTPDVAPRAEAEAWDAPPADDLLAEVNSTP